ncbi:MAG: CYTH domain-containing protein, partial [Nanoarchaeota archaeon]
MKHIEVELRSLISKEKYNELLNFFKKLNLQFTEDFHETFYFDTKDHLRIYRTNKEAVLLFKKGRIHDEIKEEIEIKFKREEFE